MKNNLILFVFILLSSNIFSQTVSSISPNSGYTQEPIQVDIYGSGTNWTGIYDPCGGGGGNVNGIRLEKDGHYFYGYSKTRINNTHLRCTFNPPESSPEGLYDVVVNLYPSGSNIGYDLFTVRHPYIYSVSPESAGLEDNLQVDIYGSHTNWTGIYDPCGGGGNVYQILIEKGGYTINGSSLQRYSDTHLSCYFYIPLDAPGGAFNVVVSRFESGSDFGEELFNVLAPLISSVSPESGEYFKNFTMQINGDYTQFSNSDTLFLEKEGNIIEPQSFNAGDNFTITANFLVPFGSDTGYWDVVVKQVLLNGREARLDEGFELLAPSITVETPNGGEFWEQGSEHNILWSSASVQDVSIYLSTNGGGSWTEVEDNTPSSGSYTWTIPDTPSDECKIWVSSIESPAVTDISDEDFEIYVTTIELIRPNGGENLTTGSAYNIEWGSQGVNNVRIEFSPDGGDNWNILMPSHSAAAGSYEWFVPENISDECKVKISSVENPSIADSSDACFSIVYPPLNETWTKLWQREHDQGSVLYTRFDNTGEKLLSYNNISLKVWDKSGNLLWEKNSNYYDAYFSPDGNYVVASKYNSSDFYVYHADSGILSWTGTHSTGNIRLLDFDENYGRFITINGNDFKVWSPSSDIPLWTGEHSANISRVCFSNDGNTIISYSLDHTIIVWNAPDGAQKWNENHAYSGGISLSHYDEYLLYTQLTDHVMKLRNLESGSIIWNKQIPSAANFALFNKKNDEIVTTHWDNAFKVWSVDDGELLNTSPYTHNFNVGEIFPETNSVAAVSSDGAVIKWKISTREEEWIKDDVGESASIKFSGDGRRIILEWEWDTWIMDAADGSLLFDHSTNTSINDDCDEIFTVSEDKYISLWTNESLNKNITLTAPNGGEEWTSGSTQTIQWESEDIYFVQLEYSKDGGSEWLEIEDGISAFSGSYSWNVPATISTECLVRISDSVDSTVVDTSDGVFTISDPGAPVLTLSTPAGGESWEAGDIRNITWQSANIENIRIEFSSDGGANWSEAASTVAASQGSYPWTVPSAESEQCRIRISDYPDFSVSDESGDFTITIPPLNETWRMVWSKRLDNDSSNVSVHIHSGSGIIMAVNGSKTFLFDMDGENIWENDYPLTGNISPNGDYLAGTRYISYDNFQVYIVESSSGDRIGSGMHASVPISKNFNLAGDKFLTSGYDQTIKLWNLSTGGLLWQKELDSYVASDFSPDGNKVAASAWDELVVYNTNGGSKLWDRAHSSSITFLISGDNEKIASVIFNTGEIFLRNLSNGSLYWTKTHSANTLKPFFNKENSALITYSKNGTIKKWHTEDGSLLWTSPNHGEIQQADYFVAGDLMVTGYDNNKIIMWDIIAEDVLWEKEFSEYIDGINVSFSPDGKRVKSYRYYDGHSELKMLDAQTGNILHEFDFVVENSEFGENGQYFVVGTDDNLVQIWTNQPINKSIVITSPNGGEIWNAGESEEITWTSRDISDIKLEYSTNGGSDWILIDGSVEASAGSFNWVIPDSPSSTCLVKVADLDETSVFDESDGAFTIANSTTGYTQVTSPNGGEEWTAGETGIIQWTSQNVENVLIEYSLDSGSSWNVITTIAASEGSYSWSIPNNPSNNCLVKISDSADSGVSDVSDNTFTIISALPSDLELTSPNGGEIWTAGSSIISHGPQIIFHLLKLITAMTGEMTGMK